MEIAGFDHIYTGVSDFRKSEQIDDSPMRAFGFKKGDKPIAGAPHAQHFNRHLQHTARPAGRGHRWKDLAAFTNSIAERRDREDRRR